MKTLGIIGGVGPEATIDYYSAIIALYRERKTNGNYPPYPKVFSREGDLVR